MTAPSIAPLVAAIFHPSRLEPLSPGQWDTVIRQGRHGDLLARIGAAAVDQGCMAQIPTQPRMHLQSSLNLATRQQEELRWEVRQIAEAIAPTGVPLVLLKGAAYVFGGLAAARGRLVSDVDILVPHAALPDIETALMMGGWLSSAKNEYDQRYYRKWMHELPPMQHMERGTVIDVHHAIMPTTARLHPSSALLLASSVPTLFDANIRVLAPVDMVLHSATHLFHEGDLEKGLHGLVDLDALLKEFSHVSDFWTGLVQRSVELDLCRPLFYALRYTVALLETPVPAEVVLAVDALADAHVGKISLWFMDAVYLRALRPPHRSASDRWTPLARGFLYVRGHWLRMTPWLLTQHLVSKLFRPNLSKGSGT